MYLTLACACLQLKIHILEQDFHPKMDETYKAVAVNDSSVRDVFYDTFYGGESLSSAHILFVCPIMVILAMLLILGIMIFLYFWRKHSGLKRPMKVNILSFSIISSVRLIIFLIFDVLAVTHRLPCSDPRVSAVCEFVPLLYNIPLTVLIVDILLLIVAIVSFALSLYFERKGCQCTCARVKFQDIIYYGLTIVILCFVISCLMHTPYVTMAYLSDAHYATSVLVYYLTVLLFELGLIHHTLKVYFDLRKQNKLNLFMAVFLIVLLLIFLYGLVISLSFYYYYIPINNTITDLPNEGIVVYQTALVLAGAYITYKTVFQKDKKLKEMHAMDNTICGTIKANITVLKREIAVANSEIAVANNEIAALNAKITIPQSENDDGAAAEITKKRGEIKTQLDKVVKNRKAILVWEKQIQLMKIQRSIICIAEGHSNPSMDVNDLLKDLKGQEKTLLADIQSSKYFCYFKQKKDDREEVNGENNESSQKQGSDHDKQADGENNTQKQGDKINNGHREQTNGEKIIDHEVESGENRPRRHITVGIVACLQHCVEGYRSSRQDAYEMRLLNDTEQ